MQTLRPLLDAVEGRLGASLLSSRNAAGGLRSTRAHGIVIYSFIIASMVEYNCVLSLTSTYGLFGFRLLTM